MDVVLTHHATKRAAEMDAPIQAIETIVRCPSVTRPSKNRHGTPGTIAVCETHPAWAVVFVTEGDKAIVLTVVFRTTETYARQGATYTPKGATA